MESNVLTRLNRVAARQTVTLTHYGRKSGKPCDVTIRFVVEDDKVYIGTANVNRQWVRNVQKTPQVKLSSCPSAVRRSTAQHAFSPTAPSINAPWRRFERSTACIGRSLRWGRFFGAMRSEERRVGKEWRDRGAQ